MAECKWCGKNGFFLSVNSDGLCKLCEPEVRREVYRNGKIIQDIEKLLENQTDMEISLKRCTVIINKVREILKYEKKGIPTYTPLPSELIAEYTEKHDKIIMESMPEKNN